ncbi:21851_t:CDS:2, partial [Gigaspora rosea]
HEQILANESNREIINDNGPENQLNDSPLYASNITDQETNIESSFEMPEKDSTNGIEKAEFSQIDDGRDELDNTLSTQQSSSIKENADILLLYNIPSSDEITQVNEIQGTKSNDQDQRPIVLWSHPRSLSTVFERPFLQRPQEFHVIHEPINPISRAY